MQIQDDSDPSTADPQFHFWLVAGQVVFTNGSDEIQSLPVTSTFATDKQELGIYQLGKAQQALQQEMFRKLGDTDVSQLTVVDVLLLALTHLGQMTPAQFTEMPAGVGVRQTQDILIDAGDEPFNPLEAARAADNIFKFPGA